MSFTMQRLRSLLPGQSTNIQRHSVSLEPEIGFQISIETQQNTVNNSMLTVPQLNVNLIAARHLPALFGFKIVHGYLIKVKLFPGSKRLDSSIQTNSWPKFNETFKFPLAPEYKSSLKHSTRRGSRTVCDITPEELFEGQFVVFTVYALLELPPANFNRFNKTYRSLRDKSSNFVQKVVENTSNKSKDDKENTANGHQNDVDSQKPKRKPNDVNPRDAMPPLTISESRRNIGSVTCYLEPKLFKRNSRTGQYSTEELWLPIKDITKTVPKDHDNANNLANSPKGVVEIILEVRDLTIKTDGDDDEQQQQISKPNTPLKTPTTPTTPTFETIGNITIPTTTNTTNGSDTCSTNSSNPTNSSLSSNATTPKHHQWTRMTSEMRRKMGLSNNKSQQNHDLVLRITISRMRCSHKVKDELEATAGSVYVKTSIFEHGIYIDSWKSPNFYPSLSTKFDNGKNVNATICVPLKSYDDLENILIRTTLGTKTKMNKKLVLGTVILGAEIGGSGGDQMKLLQQTQANEKITTWHCYQ